MSLFMSDNCKLLTSQFSSTHPPWEKSIHNPEPIVAVADCWPLFGGKKRSDLSDMFEVFENAKNWKSFLTPFGPLCTVRKNIFNLIALNLGGPSQICLLLKKNCLWQGSSLRPYSPKSEALSTTPPNIAYKCMFFWSIIKTILLL